jgi:hypothetical protein
VSETEICMVTLLYPPAYSGQGRQCAILSAGLAVVAGIGDAGDLTAELTVSEAKLLAYMMQHPHDVLSCRELA